MTRRSRLAVLVATWAPGGNVAPLLSLAGLLRGRGHRVDVLASAATREAAKQAGFTPLLYRRSPEPNVSVPFEAQAAHVLRAIASVEIAGEVEDALVRTKPDLLVADCMLPAAFVAAEIASIPAVSVVHFLYGLARTQMARTGSGWTTDLDQLNATRRVLGLAAVADPLTAWEAPDLVLVTAPRWLDLEVSYPRNVVHAGPLGVCVAPSSATAFGTERPAVAVSFSTTAIEGQSALVDRVCEALGGVNVDAVLTLGSPQLESFHAPENVKVVGFADHDALFPRCQAVVCHGGLGTVLRALTHGVPLLVVPLARDQFFNAERISRLGAGINLPADAAVVDVRAALDQLIEAPKFRHAAVAAAARIAAANPDIAAREAVERVVPGTR